MMLKPFTLTGSHVRLAPLGLEHVDALVAASTAEHPPGLYDWSPVPQTKSDAIRYVEAALVLRKADKAIAFATVRASDDVVIGSTRFFDVEYWPWPAGHRFNNRTTPDVCEIGYTWLTAPAIRTAANTEAKLLMLTHAFESWQVHRVCFHTDVRNHRSKEALARIGGHFEGILRAHRMSSDFIPRDSARFSIIATEWPAVKGKLEQMLNL